MSTNIEGSTDFSRKKGEVWKTTIEMTSSEEKPIKLASIGNSGPLNHAFFTGSAQKIPSGGTDYVRVPIQFKLHPSEIKTSGRGSNKTTEEGYFKVEAFIPADNDQTILDTVNPTSTVEMEVGVWEYEVVYSDTENPVSDSNVRVIVSGNLTIEDRVFDLGSVPGAFVYTAPTE